MAQDFSLESIKTLLSISNFDLNAIIRGMQLTLVGGNDVITPSAACRCLLLLLELT